LRLDLLLDQLGGARNALGLLARLVPRSELVETEGSRTQVSALIQTAFVADDLARVQCGPSPAGWFSLRTVETSTAKILSFLGCGIIGMLNRETGMRKIRHAMHGA
jgi:hypothetical protein